MEFLEKMVQSIIIGQERSLNKMSEWFLHKHEGNSFYFRDKSMPDTDMQGFTLTYLKQRYTVLTDDIHA